MRSEETLADWWALADMMGTISTAVVNFIMEQTNEARSTHQNEPSSEYNIPFPKIESLE